MMIRNKGYKPQHLKIKFCFSRVETNATTCHKAGLQVVKCHRKNLTSTTRAAKGRDANVLKELSNYQNKSKTKNAAQRIRTAESRARESQEQRDERLQQNITRTRVARERNIATVRALDRQRQRISRSLTRASFVRLAFEYAPDINYSAHSKIAIGGMDKSFATTANDNYQIVIKADKVPLGEHAGRFNAPTVDEVAVIMVGDYRNNKVSSMNYYAHRIMVRQHQDNYILRYRQLFHQYIVDMYAKVESERLRFLRFNQAKLRSEEYIHLRDAVAGNIDGNLNPNDIGNAFILPSSYIGSPRNMQGIHARCDDLRTSLRPTGFIYYIHM
ncbi:helitron_like_N domain-containing protein [Trichonephila clavipes]|uniref:Helitron_like_N domain-containing protein n=1 Tax=Trichonephila clavipes TaxID=2585209 RepID=A0A8X6VYU2_TRICX|nr:helitron_like_N domain-containing protein [Trichonephila clavipes]